jgi:hypothetical protein
MSMLMNLVKHRSYRHATFMMCVYNNNYNIFFDGSAWGTKTCNFLKHPTQHKNPDFTKIWQSTIEGLSSLTLAYRA